METRDDSTPDRDEARRLLDAATSAEHETRNPPLPWGFFIAQAALLALALSAQVLPASAARGISTLAVMCVFAVGVRWVFRRPGYGAVAPDGRAALPYLVALLLLAGTPALLAIGLEMPWLWVVAAALAAATTLDMGRRYRESFGHA